MRPAPLTRRVQTTVAWTGTDLVVWGGASVHGRQPTLSGDGAVWNPDTGDWRRMAPSPLSPRADARAVWDGHRLLIWGGDNASSSRSRFHAYADGAAYDPASNTWSRLPASPLTPRSQVLAFWTGTEAVFLQATDPLVADPPASRPQGVAGAAYDPLRRRWTSLPAFPHPEHGREAGLSAVWTGHQLLAWATYRHDTQQPSGLFVTHAVEVAASWTPGQSRWQRLARPAYPTLGATATWTGRRAVLTAAPFCPPQASCAPPELPPAQGAVTYDPATGTWARLPLDEVAATVGRLTWTGAALVAIDPAFIENVPLKAGDSAALDPATRTWTTLARCPLGTTDEAAIIWTGHQLIVWGGTGPHTNGAVTGAILTPRHPRRP